MQSEPFYTLHLSLCLKAGKKKKNTQETEEGGAGGNFATVALDLSFVYSHYIFSDQHVHRLHS